MEGLTLPGEQSGNWVGCWGGWWGGHVRRGEEGARIDM